MKRRGQKEHSKRGDKQNKFIFRTKHAMIHLKYCYGSVLFMLQDEILPWFEKTKRKKRRKEKKNGS